MLVAYEDHGLQIKVIPPDEIDVLLHSSASRDELSEFLLKLKRSVRMLIR
jgi:hypothetical protein